MVTLKAKTVCEGQFRMQTYVRDLAPMLIDEPPHPLGEDNAESLEAVLATLAPAWQWRARQRDRAWDPGCPGSSCSSRVTST